MTLWRSFCFGLVAIMTGLSGARASELPDVAARMISGCLAFAAEQHLPPLSVAIVDGDGSLVRLERQSGSASVIVEAATLKALSAARSREPTAQLAAESEDPSVRDLYAVLHLTTAAGGIPLVRGDMLIGAVGVSGAELKQDTECAEHAAELFDRDVKYTPQAKDAVVEAVRGRLAAFERDFNRGDVGSVIEQYDRDFAGVMGGQLLDGTQYVQRVREMLAADPRPRLRIEVHEVRPVSPYLAVINGFTYTTYRGRTPEKEIFTVVYRRSGTEWKLIYAHSSSS